MNKQFLMTDYDLIVDDNLKPSEFRVYSYILSRFNKAKGYSYPSIATIAKNTKISESTVKRCIKKLAQLEYLVIGKRKGEAGNYNIYTNLKYFIEAKQKENQEEQEVSIENNKPLTKHNQKNKVQTEEEKLNNNSNVRLARGITSIDKSGFAKKVLSLADESFVRSAIKKFNSKKGKSATFLIQLLMEEYHAAKVDFSKSMFNLLKAGFKNSKTGILVYQPSQAKGVFA